MSTDLMALREATTAGEFAQVFNRLVVALREPADDSGVTQGIYFEALKDLPLRALEAGAAALMRDSGRRFFPTTAEWRSTAEAAQVAQFRDAVKPVREEGWRVECEACDDTGWVTKSCQGGTVTDPTVAHENIGNRKRHNWRPWHYTTREGDGRPTCGRTQPHLPHTFVEVCSCRPVNRTYQRHHTFGNGAV